MAPGAWLVSMLHFHQVMDVFRPSDRAVGCADCCGVRLAWLAVWAVAGLSVTRYRWAAWVAKYRPANPHNTLSPEVVITYKMRGGMPGALSSGWHALLEH